MITISKTLIELILVIGSLLVLAVSSTFAVSATRAQIAIEKIQLEIETDRLEFARKVQQNIDANKVNIGLLRCDIKDIKGFLERRFAMSKRETFPEENKPQNTDFT